MPIVLPPVLTDTSVGRSLAELRAWSEFGARLRQLRRGIGVPIQHLEHRSGLPLSRLVAIESGTVTERELANDLRPPADVELRAYLSALDAEPEPWVREAERIRREHR